MALILSVETATLGGSVCITRGATALACNTGERRVSHSNALLSDISNALVESKSTLGEISLFAVACGPGSFTGLRIGIATVKALAATMEKPCAGIPSLQAVARAAGASKCTMALLPAGPGGGWRPKVLGWPQGVSCSVSHDTRLFTRTGPG